MYHRSTSTTAVADLPRPLADELLRHADTQQLSVPADAQVWVTRSENLPATSGVGRLLGRRANSADPDAEHVTAVVLLRAHLVVVISGARRGTSAISLPLASAAISPGPHLRAVTDSGFSVAGFAGDANRPGTFFIGLGDDPAGSDCYEAVRAALVAAKAGQ